VAESVSTSTFFAQRLDFSFCCTPKNVFFIHTSQPSLLESWLPLPSSWWVPTTHINRAGLEPSRIVLRSLLVRKRFSRATLIGYGGEAFAQACASAAGPAPLVGAQQGGCLPAVTGLEQGRIAHFGFALKATSPQTAASIGWASPCRAHLAAPWTCLGWL